MVNIKFWKVVKLSDMNYQDQKFLYLYSVIFNVAISPNFVEYKNSFFDLILCYVYPRFQSCGYIFIFLLINIQKVIFYTLFHRECYFDFHSYVPRNDITILSQLIFCIKSTSYLILTCFFGFCNLLFQSIAKSPTKITAQK